MVEKDTDIIREYILFIDKQTAVYTDALAGFKGHHVRITKQADRERRPTGATFNEKGEKIMVWSVVEDPTKPDVIINTVRRAKNFLAVNAKDGENAQQHSRAILVFIYSYWEHEIRPRLERVRGEEIFSDLMGDLRFVRNSILHSKGIMRFETNSQNFKMLSDMFPVGQPIHIPFENMYRLFKLIKQDCARILGVSNPETLKDFVVQRVSPKSL